MDTKCVEALITQTEDATDPVADVLSGLQDYLDLKLRPETLEALRLKVRAFSNRLNLLDAVRVKAAETGAAIEALLGDGHPADPMGDVDQMILDDLDEHDRKQEAARARLRGKAKTTAGRLTAGPETAP